MKVLLKIVLAYITTILLLAACSRRANSHDPVYSVSNDNAEMKAAMMRAQSEVDSFLVAMNSQAVTDCSVKVRVEDGDNTEYFWLSNLTYAGGVFTGKLGNDPELVKNVKIGQVWTVKKEEIVDWLYFKDGKMHGNYTARVLLPQMSKEDAAMLKAMMAD